MPVPHDTDPEAHAVQIEAYRRMGGQGRSEAVFRLNELARAAAVGGIRARHPDYDDAQVHLALMRLKLGDALVRLVWPDRALVDP